MPVAPSDARPDVDRPRYTRVEGRGLVKTYGPTRALAGVDIALAASEVTVVEGPNGSGKSTLLGLLSLLVRPSRGTLRFGELDAREEAATLRGTVGVLAHAALVYPDLTALESLALTAALYGLPHAEMGPRIAQLRDRFELGAFADRPARTYSRGQLQRLAIARTLLHRPSLVLLDEPSTGLDASSTQRLVQAVADERARGAIVVVVTHDTGFADAIATRRVRLSRGRVEEAA
ncbi:MAG: ABC transporter ATP-binding protein [Deltaproteobacteria bacterium]|nr:ABC transporter ATP-binding protein [Deltaproteobacteria bacterium]